MAKNIATQMGFSEIAMNRKEKRLRRSASCRAEMMDGVISPSGHYVEFSFVQSRRIREQFETSKCTDTFPAILERRLAIWTGI